LASASASERCRSRWSASRSIRESSVSNSPSMREYSCASSAERSRFSPSALVEDTPLLSQERGALLHELVDALHA
jgi:hypothetical protein